MTTYTPIASIAAAASIDPGAGNADNSVSLGFEFAVAATCWLTAINYYAPSSGTQSTAARSACLYTTTNGTAFTQVATCDSGAPSGTGWQSLPVDISGTAYYQLTPGVRYVAAVLHLGSGDGGSGGYPAVAHFFDSTGPVATNQTVGPVTVLAAANTFNGNELFAYNGPVLSPPNGSFNAACYFVDITVTDVNPAGAPGWVPTSPARRRTIGPVRRFRVAGPPRSTTTPAAPVWPPRPPRRRALPVLVRRGRRTVMAPPAQIVVAAPAFPPARLVRRRPTLAGLRRLRPAPRPPVAAQAQPPRTQVVRRPRRLPWPVRRGRRGAVPVPAQLAVQAPVWAPSVVSRHARALPARRRPAVLPPAVLGQHPPAAAAVRPGRRRLAGLARRARVVAGWLVGAPPPPIQPPGVVTGGISSPGGPGWSSTSSSSVTGSISGPGGPGYGGGGT